jgi:hypothetical protein
VSAELLLPAADGAVRPVEPAAASRPVLRPVAVAS